MPTGARNAVASLFHALMVATANISATRYEDPLQAHLDARHAGRVTGGGSQLNANGGNDYSDIEIVLANLDDAVRLVSESLEKSGAPKRSELIHAGDNRVGDILHDGEVNVQPEERVSDVR